MAGRVVMAILVLAGQAALVNRVEWASMPVVEAAVALEDQGR